MLFMEDGLFMESRVRPADVDQDPFVFGQRFRQQITMTTYYVYLVWILAYNFHCGAISHADSVTEVTIFWIVKSIRYWWKKISNVYTVSIHILCSSKLTVFFFFFRLLSIRQPIVLKKNTGKYHNRQKWRNCVSDMTFIWHFLAVLQSMKNIYLIVSLNSGLD